MGVQLTGMYFSQYLRRKEKDQASRERLAELQKELADIKERAKSLRAAWDAEKEQLSSVRTVVVPTASTRPPHRCAALTSSAVASGRTKRSLCILCNVKSLSLTGLKVPGPT